MKEYYDMSRHRQFQDDFIRLYPEFSDTSVDDMVVKNITFVTTEACNLNCTYCVSGDTLITMGDFSKKRIDEIEIGDVVLAFNEIADPFVKTRNKIELANVEKLYKHQSNIITLVIDDGTENGTMLNITKNHKLLSGRNLNIDPELDWLEAGNFKIGDHVYMIDTPESIGDFNINTDGPNIFKRYRIKDIIDNNETIDVYNIGTSSRTYFANNIAVHNCYETHKTGKKMSIETAKKAVDSIFDKEKMNGYITDHNKCAIIEFIGGEPFLNIEVMDFICEYFLFKASTLNHPWAKYYMFSVTTNGTLFDDKRVKDWVTKYRGKLSIGITIDGDKELHDSCRLFYDGRGSYDVVSKAVKMAIKEFGMYSTKVTFAPENIDKITKSIPHLFDLGLTAINANCVYEDVWSAKDEPIFFKQLKALADYMLDNEIYKTAYCSIFDETIGKPLDPTDNKNW